MDWWAAALASLAGATAGGLIGIFAAGRQGRRTARAEILTEYLPRLLQPVVETRNEVEKTREPQPVGRRIWDALEVLNRHAAAASRTDLKRVRQPFGPRLAAIDDLEREYSAKAEKSNEERAPIARDVAVLQLRRWDDFSRHLSGYQDWLIATLGRWW